MKPIIPLPILRKILSICITRRFNDAIRKHIIPLLQAAYSDGRSTTELIFAFKLLAEKAITSKMFEIVGIKVNDYNVFSSFIKHLGNILYNV